MRITAVLLALLTLAACGAPKASSGAAPSTDVNPITGSRGGSGGK